MTDMFLTWEDFLLRRVGLLDDDSEPEGETTTVGDAAHADMAMAAVSNPLEQATATDAPILRAGTLADGALFRPWVWDRGPGAEKRAHLAAYEGVVLRWDRQRGAIVHVHPSTREIGSVRAWVNDKTLVWEVKP